MDQYKKQIRFETEQYGRRNSLQSGGGSNTALADFLIKLSGGQIKNQAQATVAMLVIIIFCIAIVVIIIFSTGGAVTEPSADTPYLKGAKIIDDGAL